jgi:hypothetical protein
MINDATIPITTTADTTTETVITNIFVESPITIKFDCNMKIQ